MLRIDGIEVCPAVIDGLTNNAYQGTSFLLSKSKWISDEAASSCAICKNRFNQLRRRHHCRCCGKVLCNKCCIEKVPLPQYGLDSPERVCNACIPTASCVTMSYSNDPAFHLRSVTGLSSQCRDAPSSVVALGGAHVLISLVKRVTSMQLQTVSHIANALHSLCRHESLSHWLADLGVLEAICQMLSFGVNSSNASNLPIITDCLGSIRILAKADDRLKSAVFNTGCFPTLLNLCDHSDPSVSLVATSTLCLLAECPQNHRVFIAQQDALRSILMKVSQSKDEQVTEHALRIIVLLSTGDEEVKHVISSEDAACGGILAHILQSKPNNLQITASAASVVANLATNERDQVLLQSSLRAVLEKLSSSHPEYVTVQLARATANFSSHPAHASTMLSNMAAVVSMLSSKGSKINLHAIRVVFNLFRFRNKETITSLCRNGVAEFLYRFTELGDVMNQMTRLLEQAAPPVTS